MRTNIIIAMAVVSIAFIGVVIEAIYCAAVGNVPCLKGMLDAGVQAVGVTVIILSILMFWFSPDRTEPETAEKGVEK